MAGELYDYGLPPDVPSYSDDPKGYDMDERGYTAEFVDDDDNPALLVTSVGPSAYAEVSIIEGAACAALYDLSDEWAATEPVGDENLVHEDEDMQYDDGEADDAAFAAEQVAEAASWRALVAEANVGAVRADLMSIRAHYQGRVPPDVAAIGVVLTAQTTDAVLEGLARMITDGTDAPEGSTAHSDGVGAQRIWEGIMRTARRNIGHPPA